MTDKTPATGGWIAKIVAPFMESRLSILLIMTALCLGAAAILVTPREEEPQIVVPLADVYIHAPGASPQEIETLVATPLERLLWQIDGVEYVYSTSRKDMAIVTVRFFVGEDRENSLIKLYNQIAMNTDQVPSIVTGWVVKPIEIDDVPIATITLYSARYDDYVLHRVGEEVLARLSQLPNISRTNIIGGRKREVRVALNPELMAGHAMTISDVERALKGADQSMVAGELTRFDRTYTVTTNSFISTAKQVADLMVGVHDGRPVYVRDIAQVIDGPEEVQSYTRLGFSNRQRMAAGMTGQPDAYPAVTLAIAKKKGTNAVWVARDVLDRFEELKQTVIPDGISYRVTRNYGATAQQKVNDLLASLVFAIVTVVLLLAFTLGWREAIIVALAVPISFSLALFVNYVFGYTINRVTLFALILSLGLVVDDPITNVDNIQRHILRGKHDPKTATLIGVNEVLPPVIMSTLAIIVSFTPLFFITGMMGPYMAPMAANVPITVSFSTVCALSIVPWLAYKMMKNKKPKKGQPDTGVNPTISKIYRFFVAPFMASRLARFLLLIGIVGLLALSIGLAAYRYVPLKMLPFDNKNEFQIVVNMPEGTTLETTDGVLRAFEDYLRTVDEVVDFVSYVGIASPMDFNGMVRHYYLRKGGNVGDIRIDLLDKKKREQQSHAIVLRLRKDLEKIAKKQGAKIEIVEVPPGPPVISTVVAEIYGAPDRSYAQLIEGAKYVEKVMAKEPFVVDIDDTTEAERDEINFKIDKERAALYGVSTESIIQTLKAAVSGDTPATVHISGERSPLMVRVLLPREKRTHLPTLSQIPVKTASGGVVQLGEMVDIRRIPADQPIYHKNLKPVVYVTAEMAGRAPGEAILDMQNRLEENPLPPGIRAEWAGEGEWKITLRVFRDMGISYAAAMLGIYIILIIQTSSFFMPLLIMMAIPLTIIGAMPGFYLLNLVTGNTIGGYENPVFFTATAMIGMIALGGIVIRNSLVLIEFIQDSIRDGLDFREAILESGAIRMRPIVLTALTTALGAWPITLDPIFSGLAWTLIFGLFASTLFTLLVVPVTYYALYRKKYEEVTSSR